MAKIADILGPVEERVRATYNTAEGVNLLYNINTIIEELN